MPISRAVAIAVFFLAVLTTVPASAATRLVSTVGADAGDCALAPCASLSYAYGRAGDGDVVQVAPGVYPRQSTPSGSKAVTFRGGPGVFLRQMVNDASNVTFDGISVDAGGVKTTWSAFELGGDNVTVKNASVGNVADEKGMLATGSNQTIDNVTFHDVVLKTDGVHLECLYAIGVQGFTVRNSTFRDCAVFDILFTYGSWWSPKPPAYGNVTLENNVFGHSEMSDNSGWHYYSVYVGDTGPNGAGGDPLNGWLVRNNTFELPMFISSSGGANGTRWVNNLGSWDCKSGITYRSNVGKACSGADRSVSPASSTASRTAALGWTDGLQLKPGSPAINAGDPNDAPTLDRLGLARDSSPDAGAFEFGAVAPGGPGGGPGGGGGGSALRIVSARLKPRVICVRARRGCPAATRLRVKVSAGARVSVRIKRLRAGRRARLVRDFGFRVATRGARRIKGRRLGPGRYRVIVRAHAAGRHSKARTLRVRVR